MMKVKFQYFAFVTSVLAEYLIIFQNGGNPSVPFLSDTTEINNIVDCLQWLSKKKF